MRAFLLDMPDDAWSPGDASEHEALACLGTAEPVVLVASARGRSLARRIGLDPIETVCPVRAMPWLTIQRLDRAVRRLGITELSCRSRSALRLASGLHVISLSTPERAEPGAMHRLGRSELRRHLGLKEADRLLVPLAHHASRIDTMVLCIASATLAIAELPTVTLLPSRGANSRRARAFLSGADRVLDVIATDLPTMCYAAAADAIIWGPHHTHHPHSRAEASDADARDTIQWARRFGVPMLCPSAYLDLADEGPGGELFACNGTGGADIASAMLAAFGSPVA